MATISSATTQIAGIPVKQLDSQNINPELDPQVMAQEKALAAGSWNNLFLSIVNKLVLWAWVDDLTRSLRPDIYEQMMLDYQVKACMGLYKDAILGGGVRVVPHAEEGEQPQPQDMEAALFMRDMLINMQTPFITHVLSEMLDAKAFGNRIAEIVCYPADNTPKKFKGKLAIRAIKPKSVMNIHFVVNNFMDVIGMVPYNYANTFDATMQNMIPRNKFLVVTWRPKNGDPRGTSDLRSAYLPWLYKHELLPSFMRHATQYGSPSLIGTLGENQVSVPKRDANNVPLIDPSTGAPIMTDPSADMLVQVIQFASGSAIVLPNGATLAPLEIRDSGDFFFRTFDMFNTWIAATIFYQDLTAANDSSARGAEATVHQDVMTKSLKHGKMALEEALYRDISIPFTQYNFPNANPPKIVIPGTESEDFLAYCSAVAKLMQTGYIDPSQMKELDAMIGLPSRSNDSVQGLVKAQQAQNDLQANPEKMLQMQAKYNPSPNGGSSVGGSGKPPTSNGNTKRSQLATNLNTSP